MCGLRPELEGTTASQTNTAVLHGYTSSKCSALLHAQSTAVLCSHTKVLSNDACAKEKQVKELFSVSKVKKKTFTIMKVKISKALRCAKSP